MKPSQRTELADLIVEYIVQRSQDGKSKYNRPFPGGGYSKSYSESLDFKNAGKSRDRVNLTLTGDMLAALDMLNHKKGAITVGFEKGAEENGRAEGLITGKYGKNIGPKRDFLGITKKKLRELVKDVEEDNG